MSRNDWFRRTDWNAEIEADFDAHVKHARDKVQPLKIQAAVLAETHPAVAMRLLDRYFASGDTLFLSDAYSTQAKARLALGDVSGAAESYEAALRREAEFSNLKTNSFVEYPLLVAEHGLAERYGGALRILAARKSDLALPVQRFMWHAAYALILSAEGNSMGAAAEARMALSAAEQSSSGFRYHGSLGLLGNSHYDLQERLREMSA